MSASSGDKAESILDQTGSEILVFGCIRLWYLLYFPEVLSHLISHYYGVTFLWTINQRNSNGYESKPFMINNITFKSFFNPNKSIMTKDPEDQSNNIEKNVVSIGTKIISMPNTIRTCTAYFQYTLFNKSYMSRHTYNLTASRASLPKEYMNGIKDPLFPIQILISIEPIRIHHWSYDNMIDYQQDILMREYIEYQWELTKGDLKEKYLQSKIFGNCWCLDLDQSIGSKKSAFKKIYLKLLRLAPNITRVKAEIKLKALNWKWNFECDKELEFTFTNDGIKHILNGKKMKKNGKYNKSKNTIFEVEVRIIKVYGIDYGDGKIDDFEYENDMEIPIGKWTQCGIV